MPADYGLLQGFKGFGGAAIEAQRRAMEAQLVQAQIQRANQPAELPPNIREYSLFQQMTPEQQAAYTNFIKTKTPSFGGTYAPASTINQPPTPNAAPTPTPPPVNNSINPPEQPPRLPNFNMSNPNNLAIPNLTNSIDAPDSASPIPSKPAPDFLVNERGEYDTRGAPSGTVWANVGGQRTAVPIPGAKPQISATQQKEMYDTIDIINNSKSALDVLNRAENLLLGNLGATPYSGKGSQTLAYAEGIPIAGMFANKEKAAATDEYNSLIKEQALSTMKAIFGGNPTEGERQVLLDIQAISSKEPKAQLRMLDNAKAAINRRVDTGTAKIKSIEEGTPISQTIADDSATRPLDPKEVSKQKFNNAKAMQYKNKYGLE